MESSSFINANTCYISHNLHTTHIIHVPCSREKSEEERKADTLSSEDRTEKVPQNTPPAPSAALSDGNKEVTTKGKKKKNKLSSRDVPAVSVESGEGVVGGAETVDRVDSVLAADDVSGSQSLVGGHVAESVSVLHSAVEDTERDTDWSNPATLSMVEWRLDSEVMQWCKSAPSSGPSTPTRTQMREKKSPLADPFSIGALLSGNATRRILSHHIFFLACDKSCLSLALHCMSLSRFLRVTLVMIWHAQLISPLISLLFSPLILFISVLRSVLFSSPLLSPLLSSLLFSSLLFSSLLFSSLDGKEHEMPSTVQEEMSAEFARQSASMNGVIEQLRLEKDSSQQAFDKYR